MARNSAEAFTPFVPEHLTFFYVSSDENFLQSTNADSTLEAFRNYALGFKPNRCVDDARCTAIWACLSVCLSVCHTHAHTGARASPHARFIGHFPTGCPLIFPLQLFMSCVSSRDELNLSISFLTQAHQVFFCSVLSTSNIRQPQTTGLDVGLGLKTNFYQPRPWPWPWVDLPHPHPWPGVQRDRGRFLTAWKGFI